MLRTGKHFDKIRGNLFRSAYRSGNVILLASWATRKYAAPVTLIFRHLATRTEHSNVYCKNRTCFVAGRNSFSLGTRNATSALASSFSIPRSHGASSRWRAFANCDSDSHEHDQTASHSFSADSLRSAGKGSRADAGVPQGIGPGWLYFCDSEFARTFQVRRLLQTFLRGGSR